MNAMVENPFGNTPAQATSGTQIEQGRAMQETMAAVMVAQRHPRDERRCMDAILRACTRPQLAEQAQYAYPRGGQTVEGPSIRLAEVLAQNWGNVHFGVRELAQSRDPDTGIGVSEMQAYCWDLQTNVREERSFTVKHERDTRGGGKPLSDQRDVYELTANMAMRRMRACILAIIPGDVTEAACKQANLTLANSGGAPADQVKALIEAFKSHGVTVQHLEQRLRHDIGATVGAEVVALRKVYVSIRDGMSTPEQWFEGFTGDAPQLSDLAERIENKQQAQRQSSTSKKRASKKAPAKAEPKSTDEQDALYRKLVDMIDNAQSISDLDDVMAAWADADDVMLSDEDAQQVHELHKAKLVTLGPATG